MRLSILILAVVLGLPGGAVAAAPTAKIDRLPIPAGGTLVGSDGAARVAYSSGIASPSVTVLGLAGGRTTTIDAPSSGCTFAAGTGGVGATCQVPGSDYPFHVYVRRYAASTWTEVPVSAETFDNADNVALVDVGRAWLRFRVSGNHFGMSVYVRLAGGGGIVDAPNQIGMTQVPALDRSSGTVSICSPLRRSVEPQDQLIGQTDYYAPFLYAKPWAIDAPAITATSGTSAIVLRRCGTKKAVVLCRASCSAPDLGGRLATWSQGDRAYIRDLATRRTTTVRQARHRVALGIVGRRVLASIDAGTPRATFGLVRVRLPEQSLHRAASARR